MTLSEFLTENQTASRPLAAPLHRLFFAAQICMSFVFLSQTCNSLWHGTNYFIIIHCVFCLPFSALDPEGMAAVSKLHEYSSLYIIVLAELAISWTSSRDVVWILNTLFQCDIKRYVGVGHRRCFLGQISPLKCLFFVSFIKGVVWEMFVQHLTHCTFGRSEACTAKQVWHSQVFFVGADKA